MGIKWRGKTVRVSVQGNRRWLKRWCGRRSAARVKRKQKAESRPCVGGKGVTRQELYFETVKQWARKATSTDSCPIRSRIHSPRQELPFPGTAPCTLGWLLTQPPPGRQEEIKSSWFVTCTQQRLINLSRCVCYIYIFFQDPELPRIRDCNCLDKENLLATL